MYFQELLQSNNRKEQEPHHTEIKTNKKNQAIMLHYHFSSQNSVLAMSECLIYFTLKFAPDSARSVAHERRK